jgi:hypothetical protein
MSAPWTSTGQHNAAHTEGDVVAVSVFIVHTNAVEGREKEFNEWYSNQHLADVVAVPGFIRARRYEISKAQPGSSALDRYRYLALYEIEGDPTVALNGLMKALEDGMFISESMASESFATVYEPTTSWVGDQVRAAGGQPE